MVSLSPTYQQSNIYGSSSTVVKSSANKTSVEFFLDYNCPFSAKLFKKLNDEVIPILSKKDSLKSLNLVFVNVIQPWHHTNSGTSHEVALAIGKLYPDQFWKYSSILFENITSFYDTETYELTRKQIYSKLIQLAVDNLDNVDAKKIWELVEIKPSANGEPSNAGNLVGKDVKYFTRYHRTLGVHVTPTVLINGIFFSQIESSTDPAKIAEIIEGQL